MKSKYLFIVLLLFVFCDGAQTVEPVIETTTTTVFVNQECEDWYDRSMQEVDDHLATMATFNEEWVEYANLRMTDTEMSQRLLRHIEDIGTYKFNQERLTPNYSNEFSHERLIEAYDNEYNGLVALNKFTNLKTEILFNEGFDYLEKGSIEMNNALTALDLCY